MNFAKLRSPNGCLLAQAVFFAGVFCVFLFIESGENSGVGFFESLFAYLVWLPAMWYWIPGGFISYILLALVAIVSFIVSARKSSNKSALRLFNVAAILWTLFPLLSFEFGEYRGP